MTSLEELQASALVLTRSALNLMKRSATAPHPGILDHALQATDEALTLYMAQLEEERTPQDIEDAKADAFYQNWKDGQS